jgi:hypothetical protein
MRPGIVVGELLADVTLYFMNDADGRRDENHSPQPSKRTIAMW